MKLNDFYNKSSENGPNRPNRPKRGRKGHILAYNNEVKEAGLEAKLAELAAKITFFEAREEEKAVISGQLQAREAENTELLDNAAVHKAQIDALEAQNSDKQRILSENDSLLRTNDQLLNSQGEIASRLADLGQEYTNQAQELAQLRVNNGDLEVTKQTFYQESLNKDTLLQEMGNALTDLKEQHEGLTQFSNELSHRFTEISESRDALDKSNLELNGSLSVLQKERENLSDQDKYNRERVETAIENRVRGHMNKEIKELSQDVLDLRKLNAYYKNELSKPQHSSVGAIARQEGFKVPLASSAINYRKNNLGTGIPTLLKFGAKENS